MKISILTSKYLNLKQPKKRVLEFLSDENPTENVSSIQVKQGGPLEECGEQLASVHNR